MNYGDTKLTSNAGLVELQASLGSMSSLSDLSLYFFGDIGITKEGLDGIVSEIEKSSTITKVHCRFSSTTMKREDLEQIRERLNELMAKKNSVID